VVRIYVQSKSDVVLSVPDAVRKQPAKGQRGTIATEVSVDDRRDLALYTALYHR
jgi:hypothetical protein